MTQAYDPNRFSRRAVLAGAGAIALSACQRGAAAQAVVAPIQPLKDVAPFPIGLSAMTDHFRDPQWVRLATRHFSQLTPEWEMKMEYIIQPGGTYRWTAPDAVADWAAENGMRLHGTTLVWYSQANAWFEAQEDERFGAEYDRYIRTVVDRYRGRAAGWDTVNEAVAEDGDGLRDCLWSQRLGQDGYMIRAFEQAHEADPEAALFINDYNLEHIPAKGATFLRTVERLLARGTPIGGLGTQSHLDYDLVPGRAAAFLNELAQFGLPIHVSELDVSFGRKRLNMDSVERRRALQIERITELAEAFAALPAHQRYGFTLWGLRDRDSWLRRGRWDDGRDEPLLFDWNGEPKPMLAAVQAAFA